MLADRLADLRGTYQVDAHQVVHGPAGLFTGLDVIRCFGFDVAQPNPVRRRKIPGGTVKLVFALDGIFEGRPMPPHALVVGMHDRGGAAAHAGRMLSVQVQLAPLVARRLFRVPMDQLRNSTVDLAELVGRSAEVVTDRLAHARSWDERFGLVAEYLRDLSVTDTAVDPAITRVVHLLHRSRGGVAVTALADESGWSRRHFSRRFTDQVGLPPKDYASLTRFTAALSALAMAPPVEMSVLAGDFGYYDQSHLIREFRRFAGAPPGRLLTPAMAHSSNTAQVLAP